MENDTDFRWGITGICLIDIKDWNATCEIL